MFEPSQRIELEYPTHTHVRLIERSQYKRRHLVVHRMRDLVTDPLTPAEFLRRPYVARSRWLMTAWDERIDEFRQFYLGSTAQFRAPGCLRIVIEDHNADPPRRLIGRQYEPNVFDRRLMVRMMQKWLREQPDLYEKIRVMADDMRLLG
ncbi:hypothetical protein RMSM_00904 [Rhodopirellula maiorica SM1]|uniref:Uncharacterized protein n=1 Tax=Rhodopirellula maiorica SM1 TaxID=1265738 RepID=M5RSH6_9BACT|nr:hypothetical protein [Rhodopirellula maiorica]EMI22171.1 hypothetical protein RMSM_00904 [Rhodopirellula maiorica SM1]